METSIEASYRNALSQTLFKILEFATKEWKANPLCLKYVNAVCERRMIIYLLGWSDSSIEAARVTQFTFGAAARMISGRSSSPVLAILMLWKFSIVEF